MRKHIFGFAVFALILGTTILVYQLINPKLEIATSCFPTARKDSSYPVIKPKGFAKDIYTINAQSVVADVKSKKIYVGIDNSMLSQPSNKFAKVVIFSEGAGEAAFETRWLNYVKSTNLVFSCDGCGSMTAKKNYYARIYFADAPDDANLKLRLENEKSGDYYLQTTSVLVSSGKR